jgi:DHA3 family tetracycline resistance protein-like MFS transporter
MTLINFFDLRTPMFIGAAILLITCLFLFLRMPERHFQPLHRHTHNAWREFRQQAYQGGLAVWKSPILLCILGTTLFLGLASEGIDRLDTAHLLHDFMLPELWGLKPVTWPGFMGIGGILLSLAGTKITRHLVNTDQPRTLLRALLFIHVLLIAAVIVFALAGNFFVALCAHWCMGTLRTVSSPLLVTWLTQQTAPGQRATIFSFNGMVDPVGEIAGGPLVGLVGTFFSLRTAMFSVSLLMSPVLFFFIRGSRLQTDRPTISPPVQDTPAEFSVPAGSQEL